MFRTFLIHLSCLRLQPVGTQPVLQAIQLGTADSSARFRVKTVGVVEKALGVDKEVTARHFGPWPKGSVSCPPSSEKPRAPSSCRSEAGKSCGQTFPATGVTMAA
jgi:hypothetical protein